ncbi:isopentenyl pyrophosphate isomerase, partial [Halorubrum sp. E3]
QVTSLSPEEIDERARTESERALAALDDADPPETEAIEYLRDLAEFVVVRER